MHDGVLLFLFPQLTGPQKTALVAARRRRFGCFGCLGQVGERLDPCWLDRNLEPRPPHRRPFSFRQKAGRHHCNPPRIGVKENQAGSRPKVSTQPQRKPRGREPGDSRHRECRRSGRSMTTKETVDSVDWCDESPDSVLGGADGRPKPLLLGLPCSRCRAYYEAQLTTCPICGCTERVSPTEGSPTIRPSSRAA